jgi:5-(carboxyamino)imidazole ribonucleotide mutase
MSDATVAIVMGSDSDWPIMEEAAKVLEGFGITYSAQVISAHRMPLETVDFAQNAHFNGVKVIIAGAGGAAALPGVIAALTPLPVIGVPISLKVLDGMDSLLSIVQMPAGIPVATVGVGAAKNAGLLAARMLGIGDIEITKKIVANMAEIHDEAKAKGENLKARRTQKTGF